MYDGSNAESCRAMPTYSKQLTHEDSKTQKELRTALPD